MSFLNKLLADPEAFEALISRYEKALEENKATLSSVLGVQTLLEKTEDLEAKISELELTKKILQDDIDAMRVEAESVLEAATLEKLSVDKDKEKLKEDLAAVKIFKSELKDSEENILDRLKAVKEDEKANADKKEELSEWIANMGILISKFPG